MGEERQRKNVANLPSYTPRYNVRMENPINSGTRVVLDLANSRHTIVVEVIRRP